MSVAWLPWLKNRDITLLHDNGEMATSSGVDGTGTEWPSPVGLSLGILAVIVGQIVVICYMYTMRKWGGLKPVQSRGAQEYRFEEAIATHVSEVGGLLLLGFYLCATWMFNLMPSSYYSFEGGVQPLMVLMQLILQDMMQTVMHYGEHKIHPVLYKNSHKPHHRFTNPRWADAFNGSITDTFFMILVPLFITANLPLQRLVVHDFRHHVLILADFDSLRVLAPLGSPVPPIGSRYSW